MMETVFDYADDIISEVLEHIDIVGVHEANLNADVEVVDIEKLVIAVSKAILKCMAELQTTLSQVTEEQMNQELQRWLVEEKRDKKRDKKK